MYSLVSLLCLFKIMGTISIKVQIIPFTRQSCSLLKDAHVSVFSEFVFYFSISVLNINSTNLFLPILSLLPSPKDKKVGFSKLYRKMTCLSFKPGQIDKKIIWARVCSKISGFQPASILISQLKILQRTNCIVLR